jgi:High potential iron-sulfur protein
MTDRSPSLSLSRRQLIAAMPLAMFAAAGVHAAEELQPLQMSNPTAAALAYVPDAANADKSRYPAGSKQTCANCLHFKSLDADWGSCALFPGFKVKSAGWCAGWVATQGTGNG